MKSISRSRLLGIKGLWLLAAALLLALLMWPDGGQGTVSSEAGTEARHAQADTPGLVVSYTYDAAGRLTQADYGAGRRVVYTYDQAGNLLRRAAQGDAAPSQPLAVGWNLVSFPLAPTNTAITLALSSIAGQYDLVYAYDAANAASPWKKYNTAAPAFLNTLKLVSETQGLWIRVSAPVSLTVTGTLPANPAISLKQGWNLVGYPSQTMRPVTVALASIDGEYDLVYAYDPSSASPWKKYNVAAPAFLNTLKEMGPGWGYWIRAKEDCVWQVP